MRKEVAVISILFSPASRAVEALHRGQDLSPCTGKILAVVLLQPLYTWELLALVLQHNASLLAFGCASSLKWGHPCQGIFIFTVLNCYLFLSTRPWTLRCCLDRQSLLPEKKAAAKLVTARCGGTDVQSQVCPCSELYQYHLAGDLLPVRKPLDIGPPGYQWLPAFLICPCHPKSH